MSSAEAESRIRAHLEKEMTGPPQVDPGLLDQLVRDALRWRDQWCHADLGDSDLEASADIFGASFRLWLVPAGNRGMAALTNWARFQVDGNAQRAADLAMESYTQVLELHANCVERHQAGRSLVSYRYPESRLTTDNATGYLRTRIKWMRNNEGRRPWHEFYEEETMPKTEIQATPAEDTHIEGKSWSVAMRFAALWYIADQSKDTIHWWDMALHALGLKKAGFDTRGSQRMHPNRAEKKLRVRVRACLGLAPWLRRWVAFQKDGWWDDAQDLMPRKLDDTLPLDAVRNALDQIRPALEAEIERLEEQTEIERKALRGSLIKNAHPEGLCAKLKGDTKDERFEVLCALAEGLGNAASSRLTGTNGISGQSGHGPSCGHGGKRRALRGVAFGAIQTPDEMKQTRSLLAECEDCAEWWSATCEEVQHLPGAAERAAQLEIARAPSAMLVRGWALIPIAVGASLLMALFQPWERAVQPDVTAAGGEGIHEGLLYKGDPLVEAARLEISALPPGDDAEPMLVGEQALEPGTTLTFQLGTEADGYVYLLHRLPDGELAQIAPGPGEKSLAWAAGAELLRGPEDSLVTIDLPDAQGRHEIVVLVLERPLQPTWTDLPDPGSGEQAWTAWMEEYELNRLQMASREIEVAGAEGDQP